MKVAFLPLAACAALSACAGAPTRVELQPVDTPVPVACAVDPGAPPAFPDTDAAIRAAPDIYQRARLYAAGRRLRLAWEARQAAALMGCAPPRSG
jgi:hypothetical protein